MKKILLTFIPLFIFAQSFSQALLTELSTDLKKEKEILVKGKIENPKTDKVVIFYNPSTLGRENKSFEGKVEEDGSFELSVALDKDRMVTFFHGGENTKMYLTFKDEMFINLNTQEFDESIKYSGKGEGVRASNFLAASYLKFEDTGSMKEFRETFYNQPIENVKTYIISLIEERERFLLDYNKENELSKDVLNLFNDRNTYVQISNLLSLPQYRAYMEGMDISEVELPENFYDFLEGIQVNNTKALILPEYLQFANSYLTYKYNQVEDTGDKNEVALKASLIDEIFEGEVKSLITANIIMEQFQYGSFVDAEKMLAGYKRSAKEKEELPYLDILEPMYEKLQPIAPGSLAPAIVLKDKDGKEYSLEDFKGKVVYIDFWASWCGPCRREMPYARQLQKDFADKDVVFLYISVDTNRDAWLKAMEEENLGGIHLWAEGFDTSVPTSYQVISIPNYFLIDRQGRIGNNNPNRPSGKTISEEFNTFLSGK